MKYKVAVYGSLLQGLGNYPLLERHGAKLLGLHKTDPEFTMVSLGGFPGVIKIGDTSIHTEIYEVDDSCLESLNNLEGYEGRNKNNFYDRETIETCFGKSFIYLLNRTFYDIKDLRNIVKSGNWREERNSR